MLLVSFGDTSDGERGLTRREWNASALPLFSNRVAVNFLDVLGTNSGGNCH
jgi:hypothetical protein